MAEEKHHIEHHKKSSFLDKVKNFKEWKILSIILVILLAVSIFTNSFSFGFGKGSVGKDVVDFINTNLIREGAAELVNVKEESGLYKINISYLGKEIPIYATKDGKYIILQGIGIIDMTQTATATTDTQTPQEIPKTNKPIVKAYIFSYCPYGSQFIKAMLPVYDLLKNKADIMVVAIGAMHGEFERIESLRQICIEKNYGKDKLWAYYNKFYSNTDIENCRGDATCLSPLLAKVFSGLSIDSKKIDGCMTNDAPYIYDEQGAEASQNGVTGSPTLLINEVKSQSERTPDAIKKVICSGFTTSPSECSKTLSTTSPSAGFGSATSATSSSSSC